MVTLIRRSKKKQRDGTAPKIYTLGVRRARPLNAARIMVALNRYYVSDITYTDITISPDNFMR